MFKLGETQRLTVVKMADHGAYLADTTELPAAGAAGRSSDERILLPIKQVPPGTHVGSEIEVFIYKDSKDRPIATVNRPLIRLGEAAVLKVREVSKIGAFVDWGLEKDLLLPFKQQTCRLRPGDECLAALYIDKSSRLCLTMNVYDYLNTDHNYKKDDEVEGRVYLISDNFGAFVAVDDEYSALIPKKELYGELKVGQKVKARISRVEDDGKLTLSIRKKAYMQMDEDAERVMKVIEAFDGVLPFNDKASPETIRREFGMSKNEFKRAVGRLYKERRIEITDTVIRKIN
ncbi:MAG: S1 RNA-binding domain-containing protein [Lachnospiraceae bacterium]|nr:S1 RNA-binding domain-containing protein [Lachnospiraceae bacterium]